MAKSSERIAVLGATGQLGTDVVQVAKARSLEVAALGHDAADVTRPETLRAAFEAFRPAVVVNCAAFHQVDKCEDDPGQAFAVNAVGALHAAREARAAGARTVYVSTDYVFDGAKPPALDGVPTLETAYGPGDAPHPLNAYGASKLAGEILTRQADPDALVVRVASLFGVSGARGKGGNFIEAILKKAREGQPLSVVADQWMTPTYTRDAAAAILDAALSGQRGIRHVTNRGACSWNQLATQALRGAGLPNPVAAVRAADYPSRSVRPRNSALIDPGHLAPMRAWPEAVQSYLVEKGHAAP